VNGQKIVFVIALFLQATLVRLALAAIVLANSFLNISIPDEYI